MPAQSIKISGARQHNLKNLHVEIPREKLVVITGLSGSGKSSLAFDTLYAEGQRRYVESLSAYARQFLDQMEKPDVDFIEGLSPAIAIEQRSAGANPRSTIATTTEIYDYLRVLFSAVGQPHDPRTGQPIRRQTAQQIVDQILAYEPESQIMLLAPLVQNEMGEFRDVIEKTEAGRVCSGAGRWRDSRAWPAGADPVEEGRTPHNRSGGRSAGRARRDPDAAGGFGRDGAEMGRKSGRGADGRTTTAPETMGGATLLDRLRQSRNRVLVRRTDAASIFPSTAISARVRPVMVSARSLSAIPS